MFNALKYTKILEGVGFSREQAEAHVEIMIEVMDMNLASKQDIESLRWDMNDLRVTTTRDMKDLEYRLVIKLGTIVTVVATIVLAITKVL